MSQVNNFTEGNIAKKLIKFMLPILLSLILQAMYGAVDTLVVGKFGSDVGLSGVSTGSSIISFITFTVAAFCSAVMIQIARYLGEKKEERIGKVIGGAISFFLVASIILTILLIVFAKDIAILMQSPKEALEKTIIYIQICGAGMIFIVFYNVISSIFRGLGNSKLPLLFVGISCFVNILLDLIFVIIFKMDVAGAALATVIAQTVSVILSIIIILKQKLPFTMSIKDIKFNKEVVLFSKIGLPIALQEILTSVSFAALLAFINKLGLDQSSGYGIANKIVSFAMLIPSALMQSMASFIGQNIGANKTDRAKKSMYIGMGIGSLFGLVVCNLTFFFGTNLSYIFTDINSYAIESGIYLKGFALEAILTCILFSYMGYFSGQGKTIFVMLQGIAQTFIVRLPMSYIMSIQPNPNLALIALAGPAATLFGIFINVIYYFISNYKKKTNEIIID